MFTRKAHNNTLQFIKDTSAVFRIFMTIKTIKFYLPPALVFVSRKIVFCCFISILTVVMGATMGTGTFKPEKNLVFFQDKKSRSL